MEHSRVEVDPKIMCGKPCIAGTRIPVEIILEHLVAGTAVETLMEEYDVTREDVLATIQFALDRMRSSEMQAAG